MKYQNDNTGQITLKNVTNFRDVHDRYKSFQSAMAQSEVSHDKHKHEYDIIISLLNYYEAVAIGIQQGAINESIIKNWWRTTTVKDWSLLYFFVRGYRAYRNSDKVYEWAEKLVLRWANTEEQSRLDHLERLYDDSSMSNLLGD